jgi:xanthine dehydrogenase accessory factor
MRLSTLDAITAAQEAKRPVVRAVRVPDGEEHVLFGDHEDPLNAQARDILRSDRAASVEVDGERWFLQPFNPPLRLVLVGAVHIAQPLSRVALLADYQVVVVDPREAFAHADRFPGLTLSDDWPDEALDALGVDARTAIVTLTHDPKLDDPALEVALRSPAFYIGCLGSRRTHAARLGRLEKKGFGEADFARIHGPVGLPIGARSPAEIAIAIMAQMTEVLRKGAA